MIENNEPHWSTVYFKEDGWKQMTKTQQDAMHEEVYGPIERANEEAKTSNTRLLKVLEKAKGKAYVKNLQQLMKDCEIGESGMMVDKWQIVNSRCGQYQNEKYGKQIKGYWVDQRAVGCEGDSWEGYVYVELKPGKYLKAFYSM